MACYNGQHVADNVYRVSNCRGSDGGGEGCGGGLAFASLQLHWIYHKETWTVPSHWKRMAMQFGVADHLQWDCFYVYPTRIPSCMNIAMTTTACIYFSRPETIIGYYLLETECSTLDGTNVWLFSRSMHIAHRTTHLMCACVICVQSVTLDGIELEIVSTRKNFRS